MLTRKEIRQQIEIQISLPVTLPTEQCENRKSYGCNSQIPDFCVEERCGVPDNKHALRTKGNKNNSTTIKIKNKDQSN